MPKPKKKTKSRRSSPHQEMVAKITAENRAFFEKQEAEGLAQKLSSTPAKIDIESIESWVKSCIETKFAETSPSIQISSIRLIYESGNKYIGMLEVQDNGMPGSLELTVFYDGRSLIWKTLPSGSPANTNPQVPEVQLPDFTQIPIQPVFTQRTGNCPVCGIGTLVKMDAGRRGIAFGQGNLLGAFMKTHQCNCCGHLV